MTHNPSHFTWRTERAAFSLSKSWARAILAVCLGLTLIACGKEASETQPAPPSSKEVETLVEAGQAEALNAIATRFVKLALAIGQHDKAFVDAYQGPKEWQEEAASANRSLTMLTIEVRGLINELDSLDNPHPPARASMLRKQLIAAQTRIEMAQGNSYPFNEETRLLYDAVAPDYDLTEFDQAINDIGDLLPGTGSVADRVDAFRNSLAIPNDKLETVFKAAIDECRKRTLAHYELPEEENFRLEFVSDKPWSGYNWYQGNFESLIQVNTDFPIIIDRAVDLGCHEGYPGHHTWNVLLERDVLKAQGWIEYSVYPLFSPLSITAEGSANYGIELAFPGDEKIAFERDVLFPLAGLDKSKAETLAKLNTLRARLSHARNHVAREYLDGRITREEAIELSMNYGLASRGRAEQTVDFIETYRGYVINYNLGMDLIEAYIDREVAGGTDRWQAFEKILRTPTTASALISE